MTIRPADTTDVLAATDTWFAHHGLTYFVPEQRAATRAALRPRRLAPLLALVLVAALALAGSLAWVVDQLSVAPATVVTSCVLAAAVYALTALHAAPIVRWAAMRTFGSLRSLLPMTTRALPLLLLFVTFLFINTEVWQVASNLTVGLLWLSVLLFGLLALGFLLVRLPEEVDRTDDEVDDEFLLRACRGTPLEGACEELVQDPQADPAARAEVTGFERWNLILVLMVVQMVQVLLLTVSVFVFLMVFGALTMSTPVMDAWLGEGQVHAVPGLSHVTRELLQVSTFLAGFSGLYLTVSTVTDETYREQFFGSVVRELERAVGMRAVYLTLRGR